jgi:hypothetical protein
MDPTTRTLAFGALGLASLVLGACTSDPEVTGERAGSPSSTSPAPAPSHLAGTGDLLDPGTFQVRTFRDPGDAPNRDPVEARLQVPEGFTDGAEWYVVSQDEDLFLGLMSVTGVERDACLGADHDEVSAGSTIEDLARALADQRSTRASVPEPVTVDGHSGLYLEVKGPADLGTCDEHPALWRSPGERGIYADQQVDRLWILEVGGQRVVVDAAYSAPRSTPADVARLTRMVDSLDFVDPVLG